MVILMTSVVCGFDGGVDGDINLLWFRRVILIDCGFNGGIDGDVA